MSSKEADKASILRRLDSVIQWINLCRLDKFYQKLLSPGYGDLSNGWCYPPFKQLEPEFIVVNVVKTYLNEK